jgi:23S rRNA (adenine-N6)-dimethyltransferase
MRTGSPGGRHELGQNFLVHAPTIDRIIDLVANRHGSILEIGAGDGALTSRLARLGRPLSAVEIDPRRAAALRRTLPSVRVEQGDVLQHPLDADVLVGNVPFHLTTPILRRLLARQGWSRAIVLTQWEVARKRAGVGGGTMMTAQAAPWFEFALEGRVPARGFRPMPSVDGGILSITRRTPARVPDHDRGAYERFVRRVFTARGSGMRAILQNVTARSRADVARMLGASGVPEGALPRDIAADQWPALWASVRGGRRAGK